MKPSHRTIILPIVVGLLLWHVSPAIAQVPVSATVEGQSVDPVLLISPAAGATINNTRPTFSWTRPTSLPTSPLNHYDLWIDGAIFAASVSDSLTYQDYYFYTATASGGTFYVTLKTDLAQGYHTWKVDDYTDVGTSASSETRTFYLDSISPYISVTKVDQQTFSWDTSVPFLPDSITQFIYITNPNPSLSGGVETSSNIQIVLVCPQNIPTCSNQIYSTNSPSGTWQTQFLGLQANSTYTVKITATDAASNITTFPDFYLTYGVASVTITPTATISLTSTPYPTLTPLPALTPTATPSATLTATPSGFPTLPLSGTVTAPPNLLNLITPGDYIPGPPPAPTPPPVRATAAPRITQDVFFNFLIILMLFGLPLHLLMTVIGTSTPVQFIPKFLWILAYPFFRKRKYQTVPFCFIDFFISDKLDHPWQSVVSDIKGFYNLKSPIPSELFISLKAFRRTWDDNLFRGSIIPITCLSPLVLRDQDDRKKLQKTIYDVRIIPLIIAIITSTSALIISPSYFVLTYLYLSLQYLFSEYVYLKI